MVGGLMPVQRAVRLAARGRREGVLLLLCYLLGRGMFAGAWCNEFPRSKQMEWNEALHQHRAGTN